MAVTDIRARLADALWERFPWMDDKGNIVDVIIDILLSLDDITIVDMTDPDSINDVILAASRRLAAANKAEEK